MSRGFDLNFFKAMKVGYIRVHKAALQLKEDMNTMETTEIPSAL